MKNKPEKRGMTLVEILMAVVILLILITLTVQIGRRIEQQGQEKLTIETINLVDAALGEFEDFDYQYKDEKYRALKFPLDCNDLDNFEVGEIETALKDAFGYNIVSLNETSDHKPEYYGCEVMYFILNMIPASRAVLDEIDQSLVLKSGDISLNSNNNEEQPLLRIVDAWGTTLNYSYYYNGFEDEHPEEELREPDYFGDGDMRPFPVITSAGRDTIFGTEDDITNR
ncbi:MAG: type II secretion system protein [Planctomycetes bacterium]|nr:type II secretion system protein [Planctomycetota bacterium]